MQTRELGRGGLEVGAIGSVVWASPALWRAASRAPDGIAMIRAAFDRGVTLFDTAEAYGPFTNEELVGEALEPFRERVVIATKFGFGMTPDGSRAGRQPPRTHPRSRRGRARRLSPTASTCSISTGSTPMSRSRMSPVRSKR